MLEVVHLPCKTNEPIAGDAPLSSNINESLEHGRGM